MLNDNDLFSALQRVIDGDQSTTVDYDELNEKLSQLERMFGVPTKTEANYHKALQAAANEVADEYGQPRPTISLPTERSYTRAEVVKELCRLGVICPVEAARAGYADVGRPRMATDAEVKELIASNDL